jgi:hypothetical protein
MKINLDVDNGMFYRRTKSQLKTPYILDHIEMTKFQNL